MDFRWVPRPNVTSAVYACATCCVPLCYQEDIRMFHSTYVWLSALHVVNISRVEDGNVFCLCDHHVGRLDGESLYLYRPVRLVVAPRTDGVISDYPREWFYSRIHPSYPLWGCTCCRRPIGVGHDFICHFAQPISFVNVVESTTDANVVRCICGCYIGYRYQRFILVGEIIELVPNPF